VNLLIGESSIFEAYDNALSDNRLKDDDIVIFCHDDIEIIMDPIMFVGTLMRFLNKPKCGFVGVAGTRRLNSTAVWWDQNEWQRGYHRGMVLHGDSLEHAQTTYYGNPGPVVVLDGLFLSAKVSTLRKLNLTKPDYFPGLWDFYDIHYTMQAHQKGLVNYVAPIFMMHHSMGELQGRDSWHKNREAFIANTKLPVEIR